MIRRKYIMMCLFGGVIVLFCAKPRAARAQSGPGDVRFERDTLAHRADTLDERRDDWTAWQRAEARMDSLEAPTDDTLQATSDRVTIRSVSDDSAAVRSSTSDRSGRPDTTGAVGSLQPMAVGPLQRNTLPGPDSQIIESLSVRNADLQDVLRGIAMRYDLNLIVDPGIQKQVTVRLSEVPVLQAITFLCKQHGLRLKQDGNILQVERIPEKSPPFVVQVENGRLTVDLTEASLRTVARQLSEQGPANVTLGPGVSGTISGYLQAAEFDTGLAVLLENNGLAMHREGDIYTITQPEGDNRSGGARRRSRNVQIRNGRIDLDVANAEIGQVITDIAREMELEVITYQRPEGRITAHASQLTLEQAFSYLLRGTNVTYREEEGRYVIGGETTGGIASSQLVTLEHIKADAFKAALPDALTQGAALQVITEQNAVIVTGPSDAIQEIEAFAEEVDNPTPQILIEALVVDFEETGLFELAVEFGKELKARSKRPESTYEYNQDGYRLEANDKQVNKYLDGIYNALDFISSGIRSLGKVPPGFFLKIRALAREGKANVISRPQVSTLNGHPARISIGTTQYFILQGSQPVDRSRNGNSSYFPIQQERFEKIEANVTLEMTPYVSASGQVTVEVRPEISTPVGRFSAEVPPTINTRVIESTVRLRDGETIILGGLIQDSKMINHNKIPLLGHIPLLGQLFRGRSRNTRKSELVIYLTPHVFYGGESEDERWDQLREQLGLTELEDVSESYSGVDR